MLAPEHVRARRRGEQLKLLPLGGDEQKRALRIATELLQIARGLLGRMREELEQAFTEIAYETRDRRLYEGLVKLTLDACEFGGVPELDPGELRRQVFTLASHKRFALEPGQTFEREAVLTEVAKTLDVDTNALERGLYADLKGAQRLESIAPGLDPEGLVEKYETGQLQAALLRAVRVRLTVHCAEPQGYRRLFHQLKFQRLLYRIERLSDGRHLIEVDGPFSLFESVTKYGLQLASVVPALSECDRVELVASVRWGKDRKPLELVHELEGHPGSSRARLRPDVESLLERLEALDSPWKVRPSTELLDLPGVGLCVPDLVFERPGHPTVHLEVLGFWSREAVWRRVELVERGLPQRVLFAASSKLRVSEAVLDEQESSALYVYKGTMSPKAVLLRVEKLGRP